MTSAKSRVRATAGYDFRAVDPNKNPPALLHVKWEDHSSISQWKSIRQHIEESLDVIVVDSVGYRIYEDKKVLIITQSVSPSTSNAFNSLTILKTDIVQRKKL